MIDNKNSEIILCSGIKMDKNYENVLSYNEEQLVNLCRNNQIYNASKYTFLGDENYIDIACEYGISMYANYVAFINPTFGNKWIFAWVTDVKLLNPTTSRIYFEIDVWSTWYSRFSLGKAFIEREHVSDDTIGKHTLPENLELGEYITQTNKSPSVVDNLNDLFYLSQTYIIAGVSEFGLPVAQAVRQKIYNGINSGLLYLAFEDGYQLDRYIKNVENNLSESNIYCVFMAPRSIVNIPSAQFVTIEADEDIPYSFTFAYVPDSTSETDMGGIGIGKAEVLADNYVPVNKKLLTFPYCYLNITNNVGITKDYHYELFNSSSCGFKILGALGVGCSIKMYPVDYGFKGGGSSNLDNKLHSIDGGKLPTCGWISDSFTNWLTANSVNIGLSVAKDIINIGVGTATGNPMGFIGGFMGIANTMASVYEHSLQPASAKGGTNQGDLVFARKQTFNIYPMSIKRETAVIIDRYFSRFGYKVNEIKTPNLNSRRVFNFIKVGGLDELIYGNIPASDLEKINNICRKGVTIFHNYENIGDYTISNPIV